MICTLRKMSAGDFQSAALLSRDLGYEAMPTQIEARLALIRARPDNEVFVAICEENVVGWCHVLGIRLIETDGYAELGGLVVAPNMQRQGIGTDLIAAAERWAIDAGYARLRLRSGVHREPAHQFYEAVGCVKSKASYVFEKRLRSDE